MPQHQILTLTMTPYYFLGPDWIGPVRICMIRLSHFRLRSFCHVAWWYTHSCHPQPHCWW